MAIAIFEIMRALESRSPKQMPAPHRLVLLVLADHARDSDRAWPSISRLVAMTGLCRAKVISCLNELEAAGWLERQGLTAASPGGRASTLYLVRTKGGDVVVGRARPDAADRSGPPNGPVYHVDRSTRWTSGVHGMDVRGPGGGPKSLRESPMETPSEDHPPYPPAGGEREEQPEHASLPEGPPAATSPNRADLSAEPVRPAPDSTGAHGPSPAQVGLFSMAAPEPASPTPRRRPPRPKAAAEGGAAEPSGFAQVCTTYFSEFERARGVKPVFGDKEGKMIKSLVERAGGADRACEAIRGAFADPWWARNRGGLGEIVKEPNQFLGRGVAPSARLPGRNVRLQGAPDDPRELAALEAHSDETQRRTLSQMQETYAGRLL